MLSKEVCKRCVNCFSVNHYSKEELADLGFCWSKHDTLLWDINEAVSCPHAALRWNDIDINKIPVSCPYKFEHSVAAGMKDAK